MKRIVRCPCGKDVTTNTWKLHILSQKCSLSQCDKNEIVAVLNKKTKKQWAWRVSDGKNALADIGWYLSVILKETGLDEWSFVKPRKTGECTKNHYNSMSENRSGASNPMVKTKLIDIDFSKKDVSEFAKECVHEIYKNKELTGRSLIDMINSQFPDFFYLFASDFGSGEIGSIRGANYQNLAVAQLLGISVREWTKFLAKRRGEFIRKGQMASSKFHLVASKIGAGLSSRIRVTKPQRRLFELIKYYDSESKLEFWVKHDNQIRVFDIYSPRFNALIEMHGRVWHDDSRTKLGLIDICRSNMINDIYKKNIASVLGFKYIEFWDDEEYDWETQIKDKLNENS